MDLKKEFITVSPSNGGGNASVNITADVNTLYQQRETSISVSPANGTAKEVTILQNGIPYIVQVGISVSSTSIGDNHIVLSSFERTNAANGKPRPRVRGTITRSILNDDKHIITVLFGCLNSFWNISDENDLIVNFAYYQSSGVELEGTQSVFTPDSDDGLDWTNYICDFVIGDSMGLSPHPDTKYLMITIGLGRGDIGIDDDKILMQYWLLLD